jgi:hypothetical protein
MLWCPKINRNRDAVQQAAHNMVYNFANVPKGQNFYLYAELHWPGSAAHVTWRTMVGHATVTTVTKQNKTTLSVYGSWFMLHISFFVFHMLHISLALAYSLAYLQVVIT